MLPVIGQHLSRTIRAQVVAQQGRHAEVVALLEPVRGQVPLPLIRLKDVIATHYIFSQDHARFLRGWRNADAPQQRAVRVARQRLTRLGTAQ